MFYFSSTIQNTILMYSGLACAVCLFIYIPIALHRLRPRIERQDIKSFWLLCLLSVMLVLPAYGFYQFMRQFFRAVPELSDYIMTPLLVIRDAIPVLVALIWVKYAFPNLMSRESNGNADPKIIKNCVESVFESEEFLTSLRTVLPAGEDDEKHGFDFIPFMLQTLDERRRRLSKSTVLFLRTSIALGSVLCGVVAYFGYVLVNEAAAGTPKTLKDIQTETRSLDQTLTVLKTNFYDNPVFQNMCGSDLDQLEHLDPGSANILISQDVTSAIDRAHNEGSVNTLLRVLQASNSKVIKFG